MKVSLVTTVYQEAGSIRALLESVARQARLPDEVVIVDAGSTDGTVEIIQGFAREYPEIRIQALVRPGNRSVGRNAAIRAAIHPIIAATDAGCRLDPRWLAELTRPFEEDAEADFVGGWYQPVVRTAWDASLSTVLRFRAGSVNPATFLPSTRSMAFTHTLFDVVGGFDERNAHSEDTPFSLAMRRRAKRFVFAPQAIVRWELPPNAQRLYGTLFRYARGDGQMLIPRPHYVLLLSGGVIVLGLAVLGFWFGSLPPLLAIVATGAYVLAPLAWTATSEIPVQRSAVPVIRLVLIVANLFGYAAGILDRFTGRFPKSSPAAGSRAKVER